MAFFLSSLVLSGFDYWEPAPNKFADTCLLQKVFWLAAGLYLIGLGGDSWFGLIQQTPIEPFYTAVFHLLDGTRNGIFFYTIVFVLRCAGQKTIREKKFIQNSSLLFDQSYRIAY